MNTDVDFEDYLDAEIVDPDGNLLGVLACFWVFRNTPWYPFVS